MADLPPPRDMLAAEPLKPLRLPDFATETDSRCDSAAYSTPLTTSDIEPEPLERSTFTALTCAFLATPYFLPATVPEQWVPCPFPSSSWSPCGIVLPHDARP